MIGGDIHVQEFWQAELLTDLKNEMIQLNLGHIYEAMLDHDVYTKGTAPGTFPRLNKSALARKLGIQPNEVSKLWVRIMDLADRISSV